MSRDKRLPHSFAIRSSGFQHTSWRPPVDICQGREGWLIKFDLAGVRAAIPDLTQHPAAT